MGSHGVRHNWSDWACTHAGRCCNKLEMSDRSDLVFLKHTIGWNMKIKTIIKIQWGLCYWKLNKGTPCYMGQKKKNKKTKTSMILCSTAVWKAGLIIDEMKSLGVQLRRFPAIRWRSCLISSWCLQWNRREKRLVEGETYKPKKERERDQDWKICDFVSLFTLQKMSEKYVLKRKIAHSRMIHWRERL